MRDLYGTLSIATNKLNQITKRVNQIGVIYKTDIKEIKNDICKNIKGTVGHTFIITEENKGIK